jgi:hypothetical protein
MPFVGQLVLYRLPSFEETVQRVRLGAGDPPRTTLDRLATEYKEGQIDAERFEQALEALFAEETELQRVVHEDRPDENWVVIIPAIITTVWEEGEWSRKEELSYVDSNSGEKVQLVEDLSSENHVHLVAFTHDRQEFAQNVALDDGEGPQLPNTWRPNPNLGAGQ